MLSHVRRSPDLQAALAMSPAACAAFELGNECGIVIKGPAVDPITFLESSPMVFHDLYYKRMPTAPLLYLVVHALDEYLQDRPCVAAFDVRHPDGCRLASHLTRQRRLQVFFVTPSLEGLEQHILDWGVHERQRASVLLSNALRELEAIPAERYDFALALLELQAGY